MVHRFQHNFKKIYGFKVNITSDSNFNATLKYNYKIKVFVYSIAELQTIVYIKNKKCKKNKKNK